MKAIWARFSLAWNFLTIIPLPWSIHTHLPPERLAASLGWYPFVGFVLGMMLVLSDRLLSAVLAQPLVNMLLVVLLVVITGGLHQDGLADTIDGLAGGKNPAHRLTILRDSRIGAIGATGLILALGLRYAGFVSLPPGGRESLLFCMPALGRWSMVIGSWKVAYPRLEGGVAAPFLQHISFRDLCLATMIIGIGLIGAINPLKAIVILLIVAVGIRLMVWGASSLFGGITGDILGAMNEVTELMFLIAASWLVTEMGFV
ncbi:MAG: adenosylcobinamide-GDP ribazoletransferase [Nitrospirales bacterium]|nr:adenosylcobinamide-GDP ribazoletransferase [Nitrospirales bacterium]